jgi:hypothetical protein
MVARAKRLFAFGLIVLLSTFANADTWRYKPTSADQTYTFGETRVVLTTDARKNQQFPDFILKVFRGRELQAQYRGISFDRIFAAPDNSLFLGLSNSGIPGTAVVLFDNDGNLRLLAAHGAAEFDYCAKSVTTQREWFDENNPQVKFVLEAKAGEARGIFLRDCRGRTVELTDVVLKAYNRSFDKTRAETARAGQR